MPYYAVRVGRNPGIYPTWDACKAEVNGFYGAKFKKFVTHEEAVNFINETGSAPIQQIVNLHIYTDGSSVNKKAGWAFVYIRNNQIEKEEYGLVTGVGTNNTGELTAILKAVSSVTTSEPVIIFSDSEYSVKALTLWVMGWEKNGWKTSAGGEVKNQHIIKPIYEQLKQKPNVRLEHVRGHNGNEWNERADRLARQAIDESGDDTPTPSSIVENKAPVSKKSWWELTEESGEVVDEW